eukprot:CAMPEP_0183375412 /NCGR_PEP_ID=MMETSP0164_2-20130417/117255_1 /TAXON_ID=221442 /ORGANISM="Coccolithus pelagicus ssp braarudi, Strain PLY182g" /LENGTH=73 /DNA_ID=CAMNT_0025552577 /DNA_START=442 /DNA_END=663 /DNA_ORIENTATION=+
MPKNVCTAHQKAPSRPKTRTQVLSRQHTRLKGASVKGGYSDMAEPCLVIPALCSTPTLPALLVASTSAPAPRA